eukprot:366744-Amphidinium_carterae.1
MMGEVCFQYLRKHEITGEDIKYASTRRSSKYDRREKLKYRGEKQDYNVNKQRTEKLFRNVEFEELSETLFCCWGICQAMLGSAI